MPRLQTPRLSLQPVSNEDRERLLRLVSDPNVYHYLWDGRPLSDDHVQALISESERSFRDLGYGTWVIRDGTGPLVGITGLRKIPATERVELFYALARTAWGNGFATEAVCSVLSYGFEELHLRLIEASSHPVNVRSTTLLRRIGMRPVRNEETPAGTLTVFTLDRPDSTSVAVENAPCPNFRTS